jgi:hypothetical protein
MLAKKLIKHRFQEIMQQAWKSRSDVEKAKGRGSSTRAGGEHSRSFQKKKVVQAKSATNETTLAVIDIVGDVMCKPVVYAAHDDFVI